MEDKKEQKTLNIYQKLVDVRRDVLYLQKEKSGFKYKYVGEDQVLSLIRPKMDEHNLILEVDMTNLENFEFQKFEKGQTFNVKGIRATFQFVWINADNPEEKIVKSMTLQNDGVDCKAIGALMTYANRYFLLKYFNIPIAELEPDSYQDRVQSMVPINRNKTITQEQVSQLETIINGYADIRQKVLSVCNNDISTITTDRYPGALNWIKALVLEKTHSEISKSESDLKKWRSEHGTV
jgi:hypothetical protein